MATQQQSTGNLTAPEMGKLWAVYMGNTTGVCVITYYLEHVDDPEIKKVLESALNLSHSLVEKIKNFMLQENFPIPTGFTEQDVNLNAPRLFLDEFYLHYLKYTCKAGMSLYSIAVWLSTRDDIRDFFIETLNATINLIKEIDSVLKGRGYYSPPPVIPIPKRIDVVKRHNYLHGFFGNIRPLHALEIAHFYDNMENNLPSKALLIGFSQTARNDKVRNFMIRGKEIANKHIELCSQQLSKQHLPSAPLLDHLVTDSTEPPFSDKLMVAHKVEMFSMKLRAAGNGVSLDGRNDIGLMYAKMLTDIASYIEDGANIMIDQGWMEQPPAALDRDKLAGEN